MTERQAGKHRDSERFQHVSVWTGSEMIVWGGFNGAGALATGGRYVPATGAGRGTSP